MKQKVKPAGVTKWETEKLGVKEKSFWANEFVAARKTIPETKFQVLQYNILHQIIVCNKALFKYKIKDSPNCPLCNMVQSIYHLLFECEHIIPLWKKLATEFGKNENQMVPVQIENCLFNTGYKQHKKWNILSMLLKDYIYSTYLNCLKPNWDNFALRLQQKIILWAYSCATKNVYNSFKIKWQKCGVQYYKKLHRILKTNKVLKIHTKIHTYSTHNAIVFFLVFCFFLC